MVSLVDRVAVAENTVPRERSAAQIRLLVAQGFCLENVVPQALELLRGNPLLDAEYFPGDLLEAILKVDAKYWESHQTDWLEANQILNDLDAASTRIIDAREGSTSFK